jgi:hypothetical protein
VDEYIEVRPSIVATCGTVVHLNISWQLIGSFMLCVWELTYQVQYSSETFLRPAHQT